MKLNNAQYKWLKRIAATTDGRLLLLTGKAYMQERCRTRMTTSGLITWQAVTNNMTGYGGVTYWITEKGKEAIRQREETSVVRLARIARVARLRRDLQVETLDGAMRAWAVSKNHK